MPRSASAYAAMCQPHLGVAPTVDCSQGDRIRIRQDGKEIFEDPGLHACNDGSLQIGDCMPGSSLQRYEGRNADGTPLPGVAWVSFCRHDGRDDVFNVDIGDSVQMIGYNYETGAACFFESGDNSSCSAMLDLLPAFLLMRSLAILGWINARPELKRRDAFEYVRGLAKRQAAALPG